MTAPSGFRDGTIEAGGATIHYREAGEGPVLVHIAAEASGVGPVHELLSRAFRVIVVAQPDQEAGGGPQSTAERTMIVVAAAEALGLARVHLLGASQGAAAAAATAAARPDLVATLVLAAPIGLHSADAAEALRALTMPVLLLLGTRDASVPPATAHSLQALLPSAHAVHVYDAGHTLMTERPEAVADVIGDFLMRADAFVISTARTAIFP